MNIIIVGMGKVGRELIDHLSKEGHDVTAIDINSNIINNVINTYDCIGLVGSGTSYDVLQLANASKADCLIAATSMDELNLLSCVVAKNLGTKSTIARVRNVEYSKQLESFRRDFGLTMIFNPERESANDILNIINFPEALEVDKLASGKADLIQIVIPKDSKLENRKIEELRREYNEKYLICAVQRGDEVVIPSGSFTLCANDKVYLVSDNQSLRNLLFKTHFVEEKINNVLIIGCSRITAYLVDNLKNKYKVKVIEKDYEKCIQYAELLPHTTIIHGDASDQKVLEEEGISQADALISLTGIDEENIIISMYAKNKGVRKIIAKVDNTSFGNLLQINNIGSIISPKQITASRILRYVRSANNTNGSDIVSLYRIIDNQVEVLEFIAGDENRILNIPLKTLRTKDNILIASIIRDDNLIIPTGSDVILKGDSVIVVAKSEEKIDRLESILL